MATEIDMNSGSVSLSADFRYNTAYGYDKTKNNYTPDTKIDPTGNGTLAYIRGNFVADKYKSNNVKNGATGNIYGTEENSRTKTNIGNITKEENFSYNNGAQNNVPQYYNKSTAVNALKNDSPYLIGGFSSNKYKGDSTTDNSLGTLFGENSRTKTAFGNATDSGSFNYNDGALNNIPKYYTDSTTPSRDNTPFILGNFDSLSLRDDKEADGVTDDNKVDGKSKEDFDKKIEELYK